MDELFGEVGFAHADLALKARIEREIGLTALLSGEDYATYEDSHREKTTSTTHKQDVGRVEG